jgi:hypothetical protein
MKREALRKVLMESFLKELPVIILRMVLKLVLFRLNILNACWALSMNSLVSLIIEVISSLACLTSFSYLALSMVFATIEA